MNQNHTTKPQKKPKKPPVNTIGAGFGDGIVIFIFLIFWFVYIGIINDTNRVMIRNGKPPLTDSTTILWVIQFCGIFATIVYLIILSRQNLNKKFLGAILGLLVPSLVFGSCILLSNNP